MIVAACDDNDWHQVFALDSQRLDGDGRISTGLRNAVTNKCVEIYGGATALGAPLTQWACTREANQLWTVIPN